VFVRHVAPYDAPIGVGVVRRAAMEAYRRCGWTGVRVHTLRHSMASRLLLEGTPLKEIADILRGYLEERRRLGFALAIPGTQLMAFARHLDQAGHCGPLTMAAILGWVQGRATRATRFTWARRLDVVRPFARYLARTVPGSAVPDHSMFGPSHRRLTPHIYTDAELVVLLEAARRLPPLGTLRPATYRTFFGLIAATGLRLSEALRLCCADVDLMGGVLTIRQTKFAKSRLVPLHPTTASELIRYDELRRRHVPVAPGAPFFVSAKGVALAPRTVHTVFARLRAQLGWVARGMHPAPRIHDLRHTFICRRVALWQAHGADLDHAMLALSTYVGHAKVSDTYWYLTAVPELMAGAAQRFEGFACPVEEGPHG
jgi:integrase/recombinase XerD